MPVDVDAARAIKHRSPVVSSLKQLVKVGRIVAERLHRDIHVDRRGRTAARLIEGSPVPDAKFIRRIRFPFNFPVTYTLLPVEIMAGANQFIAHTSLQAVKFRSGGRRRARTRFDTCDLELSCNDLGKDAHDGAQFLQKSVPPQSGFVREFTLPDFQTQTGTHEPRFHRPQG